VRRDLVEIHQQLLAAKEAVDIERARDVATARANVRLLLGEHGLFTASFAVRRDPGAQSFVEFHRMVSHMRAGGFHRVRLTGGRGIPDRGGRP
jgi:hypothetical protein